MSLVQKFIPGNTINNSLYKAIYSSDLEKVTQIIDTYGLSYCETWVEGYDLLVTAIECRHLEIAKLLVEKSCKLKAPEGSKSVLDLAVRKGDPELLTSLLKHVNRSTSSEQGDSLLHIAIAEGREDMVAVLLEHRVVDVECRNSGGLTPLQLAAVMGHTDILEQLLTSGADIESEDRNGKTSLFLAVSSGHKATVKTLLKHGANCRCKSKNGYTTPLLDATSKGYLEIVKDLLTSGADFNDKNNFGQTPLHIACMHKNKNMICTLLNVGSDVNAMDFCGMVPSDAIVKRVTPCSTFFEDSSISYLLGKHFLRLKVAGFPLNKKNQAFFDTFYNMYCNEIVVGNIVFSSTSNVIHTTMRTCAAEITDMRNTHSPNGFTAYDVFKKFKDPLNITTENEIQFLQSIDLEEKLPSYALIIRNFLKRAKLRNNLITSAQEWLSYLVHHSESRLPVLPEEMRIKLLSYLNNDELKEIIHCGEEIHQQIHTED